MRPRGLSVLGVLLLLAAPAEARQTELKLTSAGSTTAFGYYVGPYRGALLSEPGAPTIDLYCVDFLHHIRVGQRWSANFTTLGDGADLGLTRGGAAGLSDALDRYRMAAWLTRQFGRTGTSEWGNIHATIWGLFTTAAPTPTNGDYWLRMAATNYLTSGIDYRNFAVVTDVDIANPKGAQEFVTVVTPEPETYLLLGTGVVFVLLVGYYRRTLA